MLLLADGEKGSERGELSCLPSTIQRGRVQVVTGTLPCILPVSLSNIRSCAAPLTTCWNAYQLAASCFVRSLPGKDFHLQQVHPHTGEVVTNHQVKTPTTLASSFRSFATFLFQRKIKRLRTQIFHGAWLLFQPVLHTTWVSQRSEGENLFYAFLTSFLELNLIRKTDKSSFINLACGMRRRVKLMRDNLVGSSGVS